MKSILTILYMGVVMTSYAQEFEIRTELRPRLEYRHGYKTLISDNIDAATFISQRSRLSFVYKDKKLDMHIALQNLRVWGDVNTMALSDKNGSAIHEAWTELKIKDKFSLKLGRQEIIYDDQRIFGNVDWAQQARSHDALIVHYKPNENSRLDIGLALNADSESLFGIDYTADNYKSFQYLWYYIKYKHASVSFLFLNNGLAFEVENQVQQINYSQTFGTHLNYSKNKLKTDASLYFQTGKITGMDLVAYNVALNINYSIMDNFHIGLGGEYLSGTDMNTKNNTLKSFNPIYGTNHKFNGLMDYFYVGNHINSVGLLDLNATMTYQKNEFSVKVVPHIFSSAASVLDNLGDTINKNLGTEIDLVIDYTWTKDVNFQAGYSQLFATKTMEILKEGNKDAINNWAWLMITVKPTLFRAMLKKD